MTFLEYLQSRRLTDTPAGDFVADALGDPRLPEVTTWAELKSHVDRRTHNLDVMDAAHQVWNDYQIAVRKARKREVQSMLLWATAA